MSDYERQFDFLVKADATLLYWVVLRQVLVLLGGGAIWLATGEPMAVLWGIGYSVLDCLYVAYLRAVRRPAGVRALFIGLAINGVIVFWIAGMVVFLSTQPQSYLVFLGVCIAIGYALNCLVSHTFMSYAALMEMIASLGMGIGVTIVVALGADSPATAFATILGGSVIAAFFVAAFFQSIKERETLAQKLAAEAEDSRLKALGQFSSGIAHDFNNLLAVVDGNLELARMEDMSAEQRDLIEDALLAVRSGSATVSQILAYSRNAQLSLELCQTAELVERAVRMAHKIVPRRVSIHIGPDTTDASVLVDAGQLESALINLIVNARDAIGAEDGNIWVSYRQNPENLDLAEICVKDDGPGMSEDVLTKATDPFFTTKPMGKGSGLGLSMVRGTIEQCKGTLDIQNNPDKGLSVCLTLPVRS